jgi:hypothetical protein
VIRNRELKDRQYNDQQKRTSDVVLNITQKTKDRANIDHEVVLKYLLNKQFVGKNQYVFRMDIQKHIIYDLLIWMQ